MKWLKKLFGMSEPADKTEPLKSETFEEYINRQGFKHFSGEELARYFSQVRGGVRNDYPPRMIWPRFLPTLHIVDELRTTLGKPVRVTSSYRSPAYNKAVGGAPMSQHKQFRAADIQVDGASPAQVYQLLSLWRDQGRFKGGLGLYPTFVHIDTRGTNADW